MTEMIYCYCGCGEQLPKYDKWNNRERRFIIGHNSRVRSEETKRKIIEGNKNQSEKSLKKRSLANSGSNNPRWNGGKKKEHDYIVVWNPDSNRKDRYILEHRYLYEQYHKCCLLSWADIHHKDGIKHNNNIENLEGMTHRQHSILHNKKED